MEFLELDLKYWDVSEHIAFRGYLIFNDIYVDSKNIIHYAEIIVDKLDSGEMSILDLGGVYSLVVRRYDTICIVSDYIRSYPLFYSVNPRVKITDNIEMINSEINFSKKIVNELRSTGYLTGNKTIYSNTYQTEAATLLQIDISEKKFHKKALHSFQYESLCRTELSDLYLIHLKIFKDLLVYLEGRQVVIPLSGGYDSRLIAMMLHKLGYGNVLCFTYGKKDCWEVDISRKIAEKYNFKWVFVEYTQQAWADFSAGRCCFFQGVYDGCSIPHVQDYIAVKELVNCKLINSDAVFCPGHAADFLEGTHIPSKLFKSNNEHFEISELIEMVYSKHYRLWPNMKKDIHLTGADACEFFTRTEIINAFEKWVWEERQTKFIANSIRTYEYLGFDAVLPLWDSRLVKYWLSVPLEERFQRKKYLDYAEKYDDSGVLANPVNTGVNRLKNALINIKVYDFAIKTYLKIRKLNYHKGDRMGFYMQYDNKKVLSGFFRGADNINSFVVEDFIDFIKKEKLK